MLKKMLSLVIPAALAVGSASASAEFLDFCVNELSVAGTSATANYTNLTNGSNGCSGSGDQSGVKGFTADKLNGAYFEELQVVQNPDSSLSFASTVIVDWGNWRRNEGGSQVAGTLLNGQYGLYTVVTATGSLVGGKFLANFASFSLYSDANLDTYDKSIDALLNPVLPNDSDDELLATGSFQSGSGDASAPGRFAFFFKDFSLTSFGEQFFIAPRPFHWLVKSDGDVDDGSFNVTGPGRFSLAGDVSAVFVVPEPTSIALAGLGLIGLGLSRRRKA